MQFACYCHDGIVEIKLLWPIRQVWLAYYCHGVILSVNGLFDDHDCVNVVWPVKHVICLLVVIMMQLL